MAATRNLASWVGVCSFVILFVLPSVRGSLSTDLSAAQQFLTEYNTLASREFSKDAFVTWEHQTNITDDNEKRVVEMSLQIAEFQKEAAANASRFDVTNFPDDVKRQISKVKDIGTDAMKDVTKLERLTQVMTEMESLYSKAEVCLDGQPCMPLDPDLTEKMAKSRSYDELLALWQGWRDSSGKKMKQMYEEFVSLSNEAVSDLGLGYADTGKYWQSDYESETFLTNLEELFTTLAPLYTELHAYVRKQLKLQYANVNFPDGGFIPAHLLGNMWAQSWNNLYDFLQPYKGKESIDVTDQMVAQGYTPIKMFEVSDEFFQSLGMIPMPFEFWNKSMLVKPTDRDVVCHASAWDFSDGINYRIKQCTVVTMEDLVTVHHEMGHIQYYLQYASQPLVYQRGANPGFHEAVGDVLALSVSTPKHLKKIGLLNDVTEDYENTINYMLSIALDKIAFLPFGYLMDKWRWGVFSGETPKDKYNTKWWDLRCRYQGISPAVKRTEEDFDPGAKYHIPGNTPYIRYFVSTIIQFQFHKALCAAANQTGPLHECDIYQSQEAGQLLSDVLKMGSSKPWPEAMAVMTGQSKMDAQPLVEYFDPLLQWLKEQNAGEDVGWDENKCSSIMDPDNPSQATVPTLSFLVSVLLLFSLRIL